MLTARKPYGLTALFLREEGGERVQTQVDNLPNEHGQSSISGFLGIPLRHDSALCFMVDTFMIRKALSGFRCSCWSRGITCLILLLCICVVTQMLGVPVTLIGLLTADGLTKAEPVSEDFSTLSTLPEPGRPGILSLLIQFRSMSKLPVLPVSVFRPPSA